MRWATTTGLAIAGAALCGYALLRPDVVETRHVPITTTVVFNREIAQIFQKKCFQCHTAGNVAVPLTTYREARPWAQAIKEVLLDRSMPPWGAASGYGHFSNDVSLTGREMSLVLSWANGGAPSGVLPADEATPPVFVPPLTGWEHGLPDAVLRVATDTRIAPETPATVQRFDVATGLTRATWLRALQFQPSDRRGIRYAAVYDARTGHWLGTWTPSSTVSAAPTGSAVPLAAGAVLTVDIGFAGNPEAGDVSGASELGLYLLGHAPARPLQSIDIASATPVTVAPGAVGVRLRTERVMRTASSITAIWPRPGEGARSLELTALTPDGAVSPLLWVNAYRPDWPTSYILKAPVPLAAGTRLVMTAYYDNATDHVITAQPSVAMTAVPRGVRDATARGPASRQGATPAR